MEQEVNNSGLEVLRFFWACYGDERSYLASETVNSIGLVTTIGFLF